MIVKLSGSSRSNLTGVIVEPFLSASSFKDLNLLTDLPAAKTLNPLLASRNAIALPIPEEAPVKKIEVNSVLILLLFR